MEDVGYLFGPDLLANLANESDPRCSDIWEVNASERCHVALTVSDCRSGDAVFDYVELVYCRWDALGVPALVPLSALFVLCGGLVCALAGGFVTHALVLLKQRFRLDEAKAGATLLTLGNGLPDIMGAVAAVHMGHEGLVVGEVLGGTLFVVGVIVGALYTVGGREPLGRAFAGMLAFFCAAVLYVGHIYVTGQVTALHIATGAGLYIAYYVYIFLLPSDDEQDGGDDRDHTTSREVAIVTEESALLPSENNNAFNNLYDAVHCVTVDSNGADNDNKVQQRSWWSPPLLCGSVASNVLETLYDATAWLLKLPFSVLVPSVVAARSGDGESSAEVVIATTSLTASSTVRQGCGLVASCFDWNLVRFLLFPWLLVTASGLAHPTAGLSALTPYALCGLVCVALYSVASCALPRGAVDTVVTFAGFVLSLCFLHRLTAELVAIVRAMGLCTRLTDEVMGLSILTYGNFVGDISTYVAIVNRGCLRMAITGCISSALMALLFNISVAFSLRLAAEGVWVCELLTRSTVTTILMGAVALCPVLLALFAFASRCHSNVASGVSLIVYYVAIMALLIYTQL